MVIKFVYSYFLLTKFNLINPVEKIHIKGHTFAKFGTIFVFSANSLTILGNLYFDKANLKIICDFFKRRIFYVLVCLSCFFFLKMINLVYWISFHDKN